MEPRAGTLRPTAFQSSDYFSLVSWNSSMSLWPTEMPSLFIPNCGFSTTHFEHFALLLSALELLDSLPPALQTSIQQAAGASRKEIETLRKSLSEQRTAVEAKTTEIDKLQKYSTYLERRLAAYQKQLGAHR
eukprot:m.199383 g.199383  ORF g.199383 m.199383 type:complete len:132 (+) comp10658_c1_seq9:2810-3205(+)